MNNNEFPFIIWTFRRSGGTNIGQALFESSSYKTIEHEPFNIDRKFKHVINDWQKNKNKESLYKNIDDILKNKYLIKHCLEIMPDELNIALAEVSLKYGYKHLFLYRENPKSRLLSLNYSIKTNIWGKEHLHTRTFSDNVFSTEIPIKELIKHELESRDKMNKVYNLFIDRTIYPVSISFEQLYKSDFNYSSILVRDLFKEFIGNDRYVTIKLLNKWLKKGRQGTNNEYKRFPNTEEFINALNYLPNYLIYDNKNKKVEFEKSDIYYSEIWEALPSIYFNKYHYHGIVLSNKDYKIMSIDGDINIKKNIKSERIGNKYPKIKGSEKCRFISESSCYYDKLFIKTIN